MYRHRILLPFWMNDENIQMIANQYGWVFNETRRTSEVITEKIWTTPDQATFISYVADGGVQLHYLVVQGKDTAMIAKKLENQLPIISRDDILTMVEAAICREDMIFAVYHAAIVSREDNEDHQLVEFFQRCLTYPDAEVRCAAVYACTYAGWRSFEPILRKLSEKDSNAEVRTIAAATLSSLELHVWNRS